MNTNARASLVLLAALAAPIGLMVSAHAHESHSTQVPAKKRPVWPGALVQLEAAREATARYLDVDEAVADGYVDVGAFVPGMGWHYVNANLIDGRFEATRPEILVYADDPCGGKRRLVALEYAVPLPLAEKPPVGFVGPADVWEANLALDLWTLHAWIWDYNPDGVFAAHNPRIP